MSEKIKQYIVELFQQGKIKAFLGLKDESGHIVPHLFSNAEDLDGLNFGTERYQLNKILIQLYKRYPDVTIGILIRGCDERGLKELYKWNQLQPEKIIAVGIACSKEQAEYCECSKPYPDTCISGEQTPGVDNKTVKKIDSLEISERLNYWLDNFSDASSVMVVATYARCVFAMNAAWKRWNLLKEGKYRQKTPSFICLEPCIWLEDVLIADSAKRHVLQSYLLEPSTRR